MKLFLFLLATSLSIASVAMAKDPIILNSVRQATDAETIQLLQENPSLLVEQLIIGTHDPLYLYAKENGQCENYEGKSVKEVASGTVATLEAGVATSMAWHTFGVGAAAAGALSTGLVAALLIVPDGIARFVYGRKKWSDEGGNMMICGVGLLALDELFFNTYKNIGNIASTGGDIASFQKSLDAYKAGQIRLSTLAFRTRVIIRGNPRASEKLAQLAVDQIEDLVSF